LRLPSTTRHERSAASPIQGITFDVGGTLIEPFPSVGQIYAEVGARYGLQKVSAQQLNRRFATAWRAQPGFAHTRAAWADLVDKTFHGLSDRLPSETFFDDLASRMPGASSRMSRLPSRPWPPAV
jgi:hypothetical protein